MLLGPLFDDREALVQAGEAGLRRRVVRMLDQGLPADQLHERRPTRRLDDHVDIIVGTAGSASQGLTRLPAARSIARPGNGLAEALVRIFAQRSVRQALLIAQLDPAQVQYR